MKNRTQRPRSSLAAASVALLLAGCASFEPVKDAAAQPYKAPPQSHSTVYNGMVNQQQVQQINRATFPQLNAAERALLIEINHKVNEDIIYMTDQDNYGAMDVPVEEPIRRRPVLRNMPVARYGDCEDYALTKKHRLTERGMNPSRLFVVRTRVPTGEGFQRHVVLAVPEGSDWWILNNWDNRIERASYLKKWWGWDFFWPRLDDYQRIVRARNGGNQNGSQRAG